MKLDYVIVAGGCFWGLEDLLRSLDGVTSTKVGYSGGDFDDPTYADIITGKTGHAEAVRVDTTKTKYLSKRFYITFSKSMIRLRRIAKEMMLALRIARQRSIVTMHRKRLSKT